MQENLIGFLLGALDGAEQDEVSRQLENDPQLREHLELLESRLVPLEAQRWQYDPPEGLAAATCERVLGSSAVSGASAGSEQTARSEQTASRDPLLNPLDEEGRVGDVVPRSRAVSMTPVHEVSGRTSSWSLTDLVVTAGIFLAAGFLFFPAITHSVDKARVLQCQDNLRELGVAANIFSENNQGNFPRIPMRGNLAAAGMFGATLWNAGLITEPERFLCPGSDLAEQRDKFSVPTLAQVQVANGPSLRLMRRTLGGSYGYNVGYLGDDNQLQPTRNLGRPDFALIADAPQMNGTNRMSTHHGSAGQNVLCEAGNVRFVTGCRLGDCRTGDDFFLNDDGVAEAGIDPDDSVVLPSQQPPVLRLRIRIYRQQRTPSPTTQLP